MGKIFNSGAWAIKKQDYEQVVAFNPTSEEISKARADYEMMKAGNTGKPYQQVDGIAIIPICGVIERYEGIFSWLFGGTSIECIQRCFEQAMMDESVTGILFDINSCGGSVDGPPELAEEIFNARGKKPIHAYVSRCGDSAAYWLATACDRITMHESAEVGSIGVIISFMLINDANVQELSIVSTGSENKNPDITTDQGRIQIQSYIDKIAKIFINDVAKYRQTNAEDVINNYGKGDVVLGQEAVAAGMADALGNFRDALAEFDAQETGDYMRPETQPAAAAQSSPRAEMMDTKDITKDWIKQNMPELYDSILNEGKNQGAGAEASRITEIDSLDAPEDFAKEVEKVKAMARKDQKINAGEAAKMILAKINELRTANLGALMRDAAATQNLQAGTGESAQEAERNKLIAGAVAYVNGRRK